MIKILVIDDIKDNLISLKAIINDSLPEAEVFTALNGQTGIELTKENDPDVVLLDIVMPEMDGFQVCQLLKMDEKMREIPVVFLTALKSDRDSRIKALEIGAEGFIAKPIDVPELIAQIMAMVKIKNSNIHKRDERQRLSKLINERTSARKMAEKSLNESNEFNKTLLKTIPFGMDIIDEEGTILFVNQIQANKFGADIIGKKCWKIYRDNGTKCISCPLHSEIIIGKTCTTESGGIQNGKTFQISHTGMLFQGRKAMLEIFQDISERKQIEDELISAKEKAEESDQLKTSFLANMSHEIRTPLNSIIGFSELLTDPDYDPTQQFHIARMIYFSGNNLLTIINNILDISKIEAGQINIHKKLFSLNKLIADLEKEYLFKSIEKGINFITNQPKIDNDIKVYSDEIKIKQILSNFISNALKFTRKGTIKFTYHIKDNCVEFSVMDTGIGISSEFHDKIFDHFRQVEAANTRTHGGNGLGLAISKGLVELLGGNIWMESEKGKGSTFYLSIPLE